MRIELITLRNPCAACVIITQAAREVVAKLQKMFPELESGERMLERPGEAASVSGLEVERFPALLIDGEQVTAGTIPNRRELERGIRWMTEGGIQT